MMTAINHSSTDATITNDSTFISQGLTLRFNQFDHLVDSIVDFKKTLLGNSLFQIKMYCRCCQGRTYWFSKKEIS